MKLNWKWSLIIGVLAAVLVVYSFQSDPYRSEAEAFLRANENVQNSIGAVSDVSLRRIMVYNGSETESAYREYEFSVSGQQGRARIVVRTHAAGDKKMREFFIDSIKKS